MEKINVKMIVYSSHIDIAEGIEKTVLLDMIGMRCLSVRVLYACLHQSHAAIICT